MLSSNRSMTISCRPWRSRIGRHRRRRPQSVGPSEEELIRRFAELSNETAGEHFTPRELIALMVDLVFIEDDDALAKPGGVRKELSQSHIEDVG